MSYELGYWVDHRLKHRSQILWRFHAVHHTAESLSPLTNFRVHPVDTIIFYNVLVLTNGITAALLLFFFGSSDGALTVAGTNVIVLAALGLIGTFQHSHLWITFPRPWNRLLLSPAHHQLHHSRDEVHHNSNFGSSLALFDWAFGTLCVPPQRRPKLSFGVNGIAEPHSLRSTMLMPFSKGSRVASNVSELSVDRALARRS